MADEDAGSEASFRSADEEDDDFDPEQFSKEEASAAKASGDAQPPGLDDNEGEDGGYDRWNLKRDGNKRELEPIFERLSADREHVKISKMFSYVLRHAAHKLDVRIRKDGFVRLRDIMDLKNFRPYNLEELMACIYFDEKERYTMVREFDGELLIRANQGHTMKVVEDTLLLEEITDPSTVQDCVHGTYLVHWPFIKRQGLSKVARNHIHLAPGLPEDGKIRGMRSTAELFLYVDVPAAMEDGMKFFRSKNEVILTQGLDGWLAVKYFVKAVKINYTTCDIEEMEFDRAVEMPTWASELAPSGPGEQGTYMCKNLESLIANCRKRMQEIQELKASIERGQMLTEDEQFKVDQYGAVYTELQSLEQRFRQHKGYRKESTQEKEARARDEAEASTIVSKKDRQATPPWERGKSNIETASTFKVSDKESAEWAALGKRREGLTSVQTPKSSHVEPKKDDPWAALGRGRQNSGISSTPSASERPSLFGAGRSSDALGQPKASKEESWRFGGGRSETAPSTPASKPAVSGPPRFFNSKLAQQKADKEKEQEQQPATPAASQSGAAGGSAGASWRDRDGPGGASSQSLQRGGSWRDREPDSSGPSWRDPAPEAKPKAEVKKPLVSPSHASPPPPPIQTAPDASSSQKGQHMSQWQGGCSASPQAQQMHYMGGPGMSPAGQMGMQMGGGWSGMSPQHQQSQQMMMNQQQMMQMQQQGCGGCGGYAGCGGYGGCSGCGGCGGCAGCGSYGGYGCDGGCGGYGGYSGCGSCAGYGGCSSCGGCGSCTGCAGGCGCGPSAGAQSGSSSNGAPPGYSKGGGGKDQGRASQGGFMDRSGPGHQSGGWDDGGWQGEDYDYDYDDYGGSYGGGVWRGGEEEWGSHGGKKGSKGLANSGSASKGGGKSGHDDNGKGKGKSGGFGKSRDTGDDMWADLGRMRAGAGS